MDSTDNEILWLVVYLIICSVIYFIIFGFNIVSILLSLIGIPITTYFISLFLLIILKIIEFSQKKGKRGNKNMGNGIPDIWN